MDAQTLRPVSVFNDTPNGSQGGIWQSGSGLAADASGNIYASIGNGTYDGARGKDFGDSLVKLSPRPGQSRVLDWFTPANQAYLGANDLDFGSGGPVLLPDQPGPFPHEALGVDKNGTLYLINRDRMGRGRNAANNLVQTIQNPANPFFSTPAYFNGEVYVHAFKDVLKAYSLSYGKLFPTPVAQSNVPFGYPGASPSISANGSSNGIVWEVKETDPNSQPGLSASLYAFDASNLKELYDSTQAGARDQIGPAVTFAVPTVANGKVYVGSQTGVSVFGLLSH
jgi:outer membrane protein assembly factor BamB